MSQTIVILIGAWLALNFLVVPAAGLTVARRRRIQASYARPDRRASAEAYVSILLSRLVVQACRIQAVERACLLIGSCERGFIVAAAHGMSEDVIGRRAASEDVLLPTVGGGRARRVNLSRILPGADPGHWVATPATTASNRVVVLCAEAANRLDLDDRGDIRLLRQLTTFCAAAVDDGDPNGRLKRAVGACAEGLAAVDRWRGGVTRPSTVDLISLASWTGTRLGLDRGALIELQLAACLYDVWAAGRPSGVPLDAEAEEDDMALRADPAEAANQLAGVPGLEVVALVIGLLDERWDGRGHPHGLRGDRIPLASRVLGACSAIRALTTAQPHGPGESVESALRRVQAASGTVFDPTVVMALSQELMGELPPVGAIASAASWGRADALYSVLR